MSDDNFVFECHHLDKSALLPILRLCAECWEKLKATLVNLRRENVALSARAAEAEKKADESVAEVADVLDFLRTELDWAYFRADMLYGGRDNQEKQKASEENARIILNRLKETGRGIALLKRLHSIEQELSTATSRLQKTEEALGKVFEYCICMAPELGREAQEHLRHVERLSGKGLPESTPPSGKKDEEIELLRELEDATRAFYFEINAGNDRLERVMTKLDALRSSGGQKDGGKHG